MKLSEIVEELAADLDSIVETNDGRNAKGGHASNNSKRIHWRDAPPADGGTKRQDSHGKGTNFVPEKNAKEIGYIGKKKIGKSPYIGSSGRVFKYN